MAGISTKTLMAIKTAILLEEQNLKHLFNMKDFNAFYSKQRNTKTYHGQLLMPNKIAELFKSKN